MKKAMLYNKRAPGKHTTYTRQYVIRAGEKGTGKVLFRCTYWPDSRPSWEAAQTAILQFVQKNNIELVNFPDL